MKYHHSFLAILVLPFVFFLSSCGEDPLKARIKAAETGLRTADGLERWTIEERMAHYNVPGLSIAVIEDGKIAWAKGYGVRLAGTDDKVDTDTMFSVASLSKVAAAAITLRLVDDGAIDLDRNINDYLKRWKLPENDFTKQVPVTLRHIMSHTAGLTVGGFGNFKLGAPLPTAQDTFEGRCPCPPVVEDVVNGPVRVEWLPGSKYKYSGGGTTIEQFLLEDVTGLDFPAAGERHVFKPLAMTRSSFQNPLPDSWGNKARAHDKDGVYDGFEVMPEMAAAGMWTTPRDYATMILAFIKSYQGQENSFLSKALARDMMTRIEPGKKGLGPSVLGSGEEYRFSHGGSNNSYKSYMEGQLETGHGVVIFLNGADGDIRAEIYRAISDAEGWPMKDLL